MDEVKYFFKRIIAFLLEVEATFILKKYKPKVVAVVGSVGKTSTKDAIYTALHSFVYARKSEKSFNSEIGVPLTIVDRDNGWLNPFVWVRTLVEGILLILLRNPYPEWLVLEIGADRPGDIKKIAKWLHPDVIVVTHFPKVPVHVEFFSSPEEVIEEKSSIVASLKKGGIVILNGDDERVMGLKEKYPHVKTVTYGFKKTNEFNASHYGLTQSQHKPTGIRFRVNYGGNSIPIELFDVVGKQHVYPVLAALAVGGTIDINLLEIGEALGESKTPPGRMHLLPGIKDTTIIDDSYNSSPIAVEEALSVLSNANVLGKKIAVLGDMLELGRFSVDEHKRLGKLAAEVSDVLITVGLRARHFTEGALQGGMSEENILQYEDARRAGKELEHKLEEGDLILIKGSQSVRMERTVEEIMAHPEHKKELLVRQEEAWQRR
jgi:UDP-N-acetylmuramyl pentapeptide synthase